MALAVAGADAARRPVAVLVSLDPSPHAETQRAQYDRLCVQTIDPKRLPGYGEPSLG